MLTETDRDGSPEPTEHECRQLLERLRWPDGITCPRCESRAIGEIPARQRYYCRSCRHFFSLTSGTAFHNSHLPIRKWLLAIELLLAADNGLPATQLHHTLGGSYKTAWFAEHRIRAALHQATTPPDPHQPTHNHTTTNNHRHSRKYHPAYQAEARWRAHHANNNNALHHTLLTLLHANPTSWNQLTHPRPPTRPHAGTVGAR